MPRKLRQFVPDQTLHVVRRGNNRCDCFFAPEDHALYLSLLVRFAEETGCLVHAYVLMTNHVHLLMTPRNVDSASRCMHRLGLTYSKSINRKYRRTGTLWEERFHASAVATDAYAIECHRYIELNPVRAGIVDYPADYRWSSHSSNAGIEPFGWIAAHPSILALGATRLEAARCYRALFTNPIDELTLAELRSQRPLPPGTTYVPRTGGQPDANCSSANRA